VRNNIQCKTGREQRRGRADEDEADDGAGRGSEQSLEKYLVTDVFTTNTDNNHKEDKVAMLRWRYVICTASCVYII
jgi:hypothetical protein